MTFDELWAKIQQRNPCVRTNQTVTMTPVGFKKAVSLAYTTGYRAGADMAFEAAKLAVKGEVPEFIHDLLGGKIK